MIHLLLRVLRVLQMMMVADLVVGSVALYQVYLALQMILQCKLCLISELIVLPA